SDGVPDAMDLCPDTPLGATVNVDGCELFSLPADNFGITTPSEPCRDRNNGCITVTAKESLYYTATLSGTAQAEIAFDQTAEFPMLSSGDYGLCITVSGQTDFRQCYSLTITEPESLEVYSQLDRTTNILSLELGGAQYYRIQLNDETILSSKASVELKLDQAVNRLSVTTDLECQGSLTQTLLLTDGARVYHNPILEGHILSVDLGLDTDAPMAVQIFDLNGKLIYSGEDRAHYGKLDLDLSSFPTGMYIVKVVAPEFSGDFKIVKQ